MTRQPPQSCRATHHIQVIETHNRPWMLLNFVNPSLEHPWRISIDNHDMWVVANDGGFVEPQKVQALTLTNAERITILVKLDQAPKDYAIRMHALSRLQFIQTYAILRYPVSLAFSRQVHSTDVHSIESSVGS